MRRCTIRRPLLEGEERVNVYTTIVQAIVGVVFHPAFNQYVKIAASRELGNLLHDFKKTHTGVWAKPAVVAYLEGLKVTRDHPEGRQNLGRMLLDIALKHYKMPTKRDIRRWLIKGSRVVIVPQTDNIGVLKNEQNASSNSLRSFNTHLRTPLHNHRNCYDEYCIIGCSLESKKLNQQCQVGLNNCISRKEAERHFNKSGRL